ncbi:MAG: MazG nucleotide pyrophosphohydrolase domain-containing protein [Planctomycetota bacterium]|jgi:tetrapyrrole methylase family protein/MazG family protein
MPEEPFRQLVEIMARLRSEDGCPWDREQRLTDLGRYIRDEADELVEAIERGDMRAVAEELGDVMFNLLHAARIAEEQGAFDLRLVLEQARDKIVRRHPHVFGDAEASTTDEVLAHWNRVKDAERKARDADRSSG